MEYLINRTEVAAHICEEYKSIYRLVHHEGKVIKFNASNIKTFYDVVKEELKTLAGITADYTSSLLEAEANQSFGVESLELSREFLKELTGLLGSTALLSVGIDYAFSLLIEDETTGQTEARMIYDLLLENFSKSGKNRIEAYFSSKLICGALVLVSLQSTILTNILNLHES